MSDALGCLFATTPYLETISSYLETDARTKTEISIFFSVALGLDPFRKTRFLCFPNVNEGSRKRRISIAISG